MNDKCESGELYDRDFFSVKSPHTQANVRTLLSKLQVLLLLKKIIKC